MTAPARSAGAKSKLPVEELADILDRLPAGVVVVDRGAGILPENLERVTERFFSGAGRDSGGYGIGLSIAVRAAEALGGALELASDRAGTRARLKLPSARLL